MLIIAERINATRDSVAAAMDEKDAEFIAEETVKQDEAGADFIDVNAGSVPAQELESLCWAVEIVQDNTDLPLCIDSAGAEGFRRALETVEKDDVMLNSVNAEPEKMKEVFPIAADSGARLVGLLMDEEGLPEGVDDRIRMAETIADGAQEHDVPLDKLYIDPCVQPLGTNPDQAAVVVEAVERIMSEFPGIHTTCGLSNIGFGLPYRSILNRIFLSQLITVGLDSAILDPTTCDMMATVYATEALIGNDDYCMNYLEADRSGLLRPNEGE